MGFNKYFWELYKKTDDYKNSIEYAKDIQLLNKFFDDLEYESEEEEKEFKRFHTALYNYFKNKNFTLENAEEVFEKCIKEGVPIKYYNDIYIKENNPLEWCYFYSSEFILSILHRVFPDFFFIYLFDAYSLNSNFNVFQKICYEFEIALPPLPSKKDKMARALYYIKICKSLYEFRKDYNLTPEELYAFIYDFAYKAIIQEKDSKEELPSPSKVWYIVDRYYNNQDNIKKEIENYSKPIAFEISKDAKAGDILVLYSPKPHSGLHSIWRVASNSNEDVFEKNYKVGYISEPVLIPNITLKELKENKILSKNNIVKKTFGSDNDAPMECIEYEEIIRILKEEKGFNVSVLPKIESIESFNKNILANKTLPKASKVWFVGASGSDIDFVESADKESVSSWQSSENMKLGDIVIMYCTSPKSSIHSIWRVGFDDVSIDPFFSYYSVGYISNPIKVPAISFKEIKENKILSKNPIVKMSFQGVKGSPVAYDEYTEILRILKEEKGFDVSVLPQIEAIEGLDENIILKDESDVEEYLVEPFLNLLGYSKNDYMRQMPVRMGRGERYYPDYAFFPNTTRGEESAKWLLETKYQIRNKKDFKEAFYQARSYSYRLNALCFVIASKEGIWFFESEKNNFLFDKNIHYSWNELKNRDNFFNVQKVVGFEYINKKNKKYKEIIQWLK